MRVTLPRTLTIAFLAIAVGAIFPFATNAQSMSHEEEVIRNAYAELSLLCGLVPVTQAGMSQFGGLTVDPEVLREKIDKVTPEFELSDFRTGTVAGIANKTWDNFITVPPPHSQILSGSLTTQYYNDNGNQTDWQLAEVRWMPGPNGNPEGDKFILSLTVSEIIDLASNQWKDSDAVGSVTYTRYATATVNAKFQGKSTGPHRAIFFFGKDTHGIEFVAENDLSSGQNDVQYFLNHRADLDGLLLGKIREAPIVAEWLRNNVMPASSCSSTDTHAMCCEHGKCGISPVTYNRELSVPLPAAKVQ